jgi:phosphatidylglycerol:prolipoprotein diacylglycerol transferase
MLPVLALPFPQIDPVAIELGPVVVRWYALAYVAGLLIGWTTAAWLVARPALFGAQTPPTKLELDDMLLWAALGIVLGGRLGYVVFYNPAFFLANPLEIPQVWNGGMAFHGGAAGLMLATWLYTRVRTVKFFTMMDVIATVAPIGIFFGRLANFINGELYGRATTVWWAVEFPRGGFVPRHPSQLYEAALEGLLLFLVLIVLVLRHRAYATPGLVTGVFVAGYGAARFLVEFAREPDPQLGYLAGGLTMGQILSLPMVAAGVAIILWARKKAVGT